MLETDPNPGDMGDDAASRDDPAPEQTLLPQFLSDRDIQCPLCRYNLRGLRQDRCPECGREIELWIRVPERFYAAWIASVIAAAMSAPFGAFFILAFAMGNMPHWGVVQWVIGIAALSMLVTFIMLIIFRKRMLRAAPRTKTVIAIGCATGSAAFWATAVVQVILDL